jgi:hypothetical protein
VVDGSGRNGSDICFWYGFRGRDLLDIFVFCRVGGALDGGGGNEGGVCFKYGFQGGGLLDGCGGRAIVCCNLANPSLVQFGQELMELWTSSGCSVCVLVLFLLFFDVLSSSLAFSGVWQQKLR